MNTLRILANIGTNDQAAYSLPDAVEGDVVEVDDRAAHILLNILKVAAVVGDDSHFQMVRSPEPVQVKATVPSQGIIDPPKVEDQSKPSVTEAALPRHKAPPAAPHAERIHRTDKPKSKDS